MGGICCGNESDEGLNRASLPRPAEPDPDSIPVLADQEHLLSEAAVTEVVDRINEAIDVWLLGEEAEAAAIRYCVETVNPHLKAALRSFLNEDWSLCVEALLNDAASLEAKTSLVQAVVGRQLREPLVRCLNKRIDVPFVNEEQEAASIRAVCDCLFDAVVAAVLRALARLQEGLTGREEALVKDEEAEAAAKAEADAALETAQQEQPDLLASEAVADLVDRINAAVDIWLVGEEAERVAIDRMVSLLNPSLREKLDDFMKPQWKQSTEVLLNDSMDDAAKTKASNGILATSVGAPMAKCLNGKINVPLLGESHEQKMFESVTDSIVKSIVGRTISGIRSSL